MRLLALGRVAYDPFLRVGAADREVQHDGAILGAGDGGEAGDPGGTLGGEDVGGLTHQLMEAADIQLDAVQGIGQQVGKGRLAVHHAPGHGVAVVVHADDAELGIVYFGVHADNQLVLVALDGNAVDGLQVVFLIRPEQSRADGSEDHQRDDGCCGLFRLLSAFLLLRFFLQALFFLRVGKGFVAVVGQRLVVLFVLCEGEAVGGILLRFRRDRRLGNLMGDQRVGLVHDLGNFLGHLVGQKIGRVRRLREGFVLCILRDGFLRLGGGFLGSGGGLHRHHILRLCLNGGVDGDGGVIDGIALHVGGQRLAQFFRLLPALGRVGVNGLHDDLRDLVVGIDGRRKGFVRRFALEGQAAVVVELIEDHANGVGVRRFVQRGHGVVQLRGRIGTAVLVRQGRVAQRVQRDEAQIADAVAFFLGQEDVGGLQVHIQASRLTADGERGAQVKTKIDRFQMGDRIAADVLCQRMLVGADEVDLVA